MWGNKYVRVLRIRWKVYEAEKGRVEKETCFKTKGDHTFHRPLMRFSNGNLTRLSEDQTICLSAKRIRREGKRKTNLDRSPSFPPTFEKNLLASCGVVLHLSTRKVLVPSETRRGHRRGVHILRLSLPREHRTIGRHRGEIHNESGWTIGDHPTIHTRIRRRTL